MSFFNEYNTEARDVVFQDPPPTPTPAFDPNEFINKTLGGGSGGKGGEYKGLTESEVNKAFKEGRITEAQYRAEMAARDNSPSAIEVLVQENKPAGITPPSLPGAGLADPSSGVKASSPFDKLSESELQQYVMAGVMTRAELDALKGPANAAAIMAQPLTSSDQKAIANLKANPPQITRYNEPSGPKSQITPPSFAGSSGAGSAGLASSSSGSSGGGSAGIAAAAPPPAPIPNSLEDLANRGGIRIGSTVILNGQQLRKQETSVQAADGMWYRVNEATGQVDPTAYKTQAEANKNITYQPEGAAIRSRTGVSPTANAALNNQPINPLDRSVFKEIPMDQSIAAGATKGLQEGELLGTMQRKGYPNLDIALGGIPQGGGVMPVMNAGGDIQSFTGQVGNTSIGFSSPTAGVPSQTIYWMQQQGIPPSLTEAILKKDGDLGIMRLQQIIDNERAKGTMPDLAKLYALNEPSGYQGAAGGSQLKWGQGGASNTEYDQQLSRIVGLYDAGPDLSYLPDVVDNQNGSIQVGNKVYASSGIDEYGTPITYGKGGMFTLDEPSTLIGDITGKPYAQIAEAGKREKVTIEPTQEDIKMNGEPMWGGFQPLKGGKPQGFAVGGTIYAGGNKGFTGGDTAIRNPDGTVTDYGKRLGYKSDAPLIYTGGAMGDENQNFLSPQASRTGEPVPASFEFMGVADKERFANQGNPPPNQRISGPVSAAPVGMRPYGDTVLPVYDQLEPQTYDNLGPITGYDYVPYNVGGTPALVRVPQYSFPAPVGNDVAKQQSAAYLMALLNGGSTGNMSPGILGFQGMPAADNRAAILNELYKLDPAAWAQAVSAGAVGGNGQPGQGSYGDYGGGMPSSRDVMNQAFRQRYRETIDGRNRSRAGLGLSTILDIPRMEWNGTGEAPWGSGPAPYQQYTGPVPEGFSLPYDYEARGPWFNRDNSMQFPQWGGIGGGYMNQGPNNDNGPDGQWNGPGGFQPRWRGGSRFSGGQRRRPMVAQPLGA